MYREVYLHVSLNLQLHLMWQNNLRLKNVICINRHYLHFSDYIRNIRDPEKPATLEDLSVVYEDGVMVSNDDFALHALFSHTSDVSILYTT